MLLEVEDLQVNYRKVRALWGVSLHVSDREIVALIGANGAGKSTLIRSIMGLVAIQNGFIRFKGEDLGRAKPWNRAQAGIALVPEGGRVFPDLTVEQNLTLGAYLKRDKQTFKRCLGHTFSLFPLLKERKKQRAGTLSGGERQMLAIGRTLMSEPCLLLVDEISMGLMPKLVAQVFQTLVQLKESGISVLLAEQKATEALAIADRGYVIENGRIMLSGQSTILLGDERVKTAYLGL